MLTLINAFIEGTAAWLKAVKEKKLAGSKAPS